MYVWRWGSGQRLRRKDCIRMREFRVLEMLDAWERNDRIEPRKVSLSTNMEHLGCHLEKIRSVGNRESLKM